MFLNASIPGWLQLLAGILLVPLAGYLVEAGTAAISAQLRETPQGIRRGALGALCHPT